MNAHPLTRPAADAIQSTLWSTEHIPVGVEVHGERIYVWAVGRELTTLEEVTVLRAVCGATDARVCWCGAVA